MSIILKQKITDLANIACAKLGVKYSQIKIKEMFSRLGSCSSKGNLNFCLRLILVDDAILEYVVAHEVCHLQEMNHSKNFWLLVEEIYPNWKKVKALLKQTSIPMFPKEEKKSNASTVCMHR